MAFEDDLTVYTFRSIMIGGNQFTNCMGTLSIDGTEIVHLERDDNNGQLLVTMDIYDDAGTKVGKLRRNAWAFHDEATHTVESRADFLRIERLADGKNILGIKIVSRDEIDIVKAELHGADGTFVYAGLLGDPPNPANGQGIRLPGNIVLTGNQKVGGAAGLVITTTSVSF